MSDSNSNLSGRHRYPYIPSLKGGNPEKRKKQDWWDEMCHKHGEKNYFPKENIETLKRHE